ncbi:MAG: AAA family ATPase [Pseudomonadales bacterium]|nr:AAA family ATPase [Pseudomonadales bacterium]
MAKHQSFYFSDGPYLQIMQGLHGALALHEALIKLIGGPQTGKSLLCQKFSQFLKRKGYRVVYFDTAIESPEILRGMLGREFDLPPSSNFPRLLEDALHLEGEKPVVLIFDDAHLLTDVTLLEIYRLAEVQADTKRMLNIVLCGEPSLESRLLSNQEFRSLLQSVSHRFLLEPMDLETLGQFFYRYMDKAGLSGLQLETAAMNAFFKSSKGYPGPALSLCKLIAEARTGNADLTPVSKEEFQQLIKAAAGEQILPSTGYRESYRELSRFGPVVPLAAVLIVASVGFLYQQLESESDQDLTSGLPNEPTLTEQSSPFTAIADNTPETEEDGAPIEEPAVAETTSDEEQPTLEPAAPTIAAAPVIEVPEPVSDSSLALVTAEERGVATDAISIPEFEAFIDEESNAGSNDETDSADLADSNQDQRLEVAAVPEFEAAEAAPEDEQVPADTENSENELAEITDLVVEESDSSESTIDTVALQTAVSGWVDAWQTQSLDDYFDSYHSAFVPRYHDSQSQWRQNRQRVIGDADWIRLEMTDYAFIGEEEGMQEVRFWLRYESPSYSDNTQKKLLLLQEQGKWKIVEEINLQVRS